MLSTTGLSALEGFIKLVIKLRCGALLSGTVQKPCGDSISENAVPQHFEEHPSASNGERARYSSPCSISARQSGSLAWPPECSSTVAVTAKRRTGLRAKIRANWKNESVVKVGQQAKNHPYSSTCSSSFKAFFFCITLLFCPSNQPARVHAVPRELLSPYPDVLMCD